MQLGFFCQRFLSFARHSFGGKDDDRRNVGLEKLQSLIDTAFVRDDHAKRRARLTALNPRFLQVCRQSEPNVVAFQACMTEQNRVRQSALAKQMQLVLTRSEIYRPEIFRRDLAIGGDCKSGDHEWAVSNVGANAAPSSR